MKVEIFEGIRSDVQGDIQAFLDTYDDSDFEVSIPNLVVVHGPEKESSGESRIIATVLAVRK